MVNTERLKTLLNAFYSSVGAYIEYFFGLLISILIARHLGPQEYGIYTLLIWLSGLMIMLINGGINTGVIKFVAEARGEHNLPKAKSIVQYFLKIQNTAIVIVMVLSISIGHFYWSTWFPTTPSSVLWYLLIAVIFKSVYMYYNSVFKGYEQFQTIAKIIMVVGPCNLILVYILSLLEASLEQFILVYVFISVFYFVMMMHKIIQNTGQQAVQPANLILKKRMHSHLKLITLNVFLGFIVLSQSELAFLNWLSTQENVAYYSVGYSLAGAAAALVPGVFSHILLPFMSRTSTENKALLPFRFLASTRYLLILCMPLLCVGILYAQEVIGLLYGHEYLPATVALQVALFSNCLFMISNGAQSYHMSVDKQGTLLTFMALTAIINLSLDYILITAYQLNGAIVASLTAMVFQFFLLIISARKLLSIELEYSVYGRILLVSALALLPGFVLKYAVGGFIAFVLSTVAFSLVFIILSLMARVWSENDIKAFDLLLKRFRNTPLGRIPIFVDWIQTKKLYHH